MHCSYDEDVRLCPERVVAEVVAGAAFDDELSRPHSGLFERSWCADIVALETETIEVESQVDDTRPIGGDAIRIDAWARHSLASNGFGG